MADSIRAQIVDNVKTTLQGITTGAGFNQTVEFVDTENFRMPDEVENPSLFPCIYVRDLTENREAADVDSVEVVLQLEINAYYQREDAADNLQTRRRKFQADIELKLMEDDFRGNLATKTVIKKIDTDSGIIDPFAVIVMMCNIHYYQDRDDPYSQDNSPTP